MFEVLKNWYRSLLSDPNSATFFILITFFFVIIYFYSHIFMPLLVAVGVSYILEVPVGFLERKKILRRSLSSSIFMLLFFVFLVFFSVSVIPSMLSQGSELLGKVPSIVGKVSDYIKEKMVQYPAVFEHINFDGIASQITDAVTSYGTEFVKSDLLGYLKNISSFMMYLILVPLLSWFMLKDKHVLMSGVKGFFPPNLKLASEMWKKLNIQLMNYISGKFIHIIVISVLNFAIFYFCGLNYSVLLGLIVGLSVLVPIVGAAIASVPVLVVAFSQFGMDGSFWTLVVAYAVGQVLDANVLTPLLFSEKMKLHPFVILSSVLVFGSMWGFWGVFFAIPLATFFKTLYLNWPRGRYVAAGEEDCPCQESQELLAVTGSEDAPSPETSSGDDSADSTDGADSPRSEA